ncbi:MAG TPA: ABC-type transport auxiliary lipoprotein family protein [Allosphingosinicella sp.]|nr:ABC-type transport auxiliary lipoprotein family protein [Allosphingosinicella sp.]
MRSRLLLSAPAMLALSACLGGGSAPDQLYTLTSAEVRPAAAPRTAGQGEAITVAVPTLPQALRTTRIPVYVNETTIQYLTEAVWVENPGALFARVLGETISARTGRVVLDPSQYSNDPGNRITGTLVKFGLDPNGMQAVIVYNAVLARSGANGGIVTNRFEARVPVAEATPAAVAPALNQAANQLAGEVAAWIAG